MKSPLGRNHQFLESSCRTPIGGKDRVGREKEKIVITHRNYGLENSTFLVRYPMLQKLLVSFIGTAQVSFSRSFIRVLFTFNSSVTQTFFMTDRDRSFTPGALATYTYLSRLFFASPCIPDSGLDELTKPIKKQAYLVYTYFASSIPSELCLRDANALFHFTLGPSTSCNSEFTCE